MKSTNHLIKVQEDVDNGKVVAGNIATESAVEATTRSQHIHDHQEAPKFTKKMEQSSSHVSNSTDGRVSLMPGGAHAMMQDPEAYVRDIHKRSVHELDISDRLAWPIKGRLAMGSDNGQPMIDEDHKRRRTNQDNSYSERLTSPDSGVMDHLSEATTESLDGNASSSYYTHSATSTSKSHTITEMAEGSILLPPASDLQGFQSGVPTSIRTPSHLQNGELPLRDYPILPPPKDYPPSNNIMQTGDAAYTMQEAKLNSRPFIAKTRTHHQGAAS